MSIVSVFATSVVSGYNTMPNILTPTKTALASVINLTGMGRRQRSEMTLVSREEFTKQMTENFPTSDDACLQFPGGFEDIFKRFIEELIELIKMMPSIIFRGVANQLDPAYKEMRQHYLNCDIKQLSHRGTKYGGTADYKLVNGLYLKGRDKGSGKADQSLMQKGNGKYVPLFPGALVDIIDSVTEIPDFPEFGRKLGISIAKLVTYIYSGNAPFLDPSAYFKIPCADIDYSAWTEGGRYDAGKFGRYGHPISPFTILALSTLELESDKRLRENNCIEEIPKDDCIDPETGEVSYVSETEPLPDRIRARDVIDIEVPSSDPDIINPDTRQRVDPEQEELEEECILTENRASIQEEINSIFEDLVQINYLMERLEQSGETWMRNVSLPYYEELSGVRSGESYNNDYFLEALNELNRRILELQSAYTEADIECAPSDKFIEPLSDGTLVIKDYDQKLRETSHAAAVRREQATSEAEGMY